MKLPIWLIVTGVVVLAGASAAGGAVVGVRLTESDDVPVIAAPVVDPSQSALCQDALQRRQAAQLALVNTQLRVAQQQEARQQLQQAEQDIKKHCGS